PALPAGLEAQDRALPDLTSLRSMSPRELFDALASVPAIRELRSSLVNSKRDHLTIKQVAEFLPFPENATEEVLEILDHCADARPTERDEALLPTRAHLFLRTQAGLWACCNAKCIGKQGTRLDAPDWPFG